MFCSLSILLCGLASTGLVGAQNEGDLRLVGFEATRLAGRLELFHSNAWYTICNDYFSLATTNVACRQLGLGYAVKPPIDNDAESKRLGYYQDPKNSRYGSGSRNTPILSLVPYCQGNETHLLNCRFIRATTCLQWEAVAIQCSDWSPQPYAGQVRLVGGAYASEGKLEVYFNGEWGAVCSDGFDRIAANSVCRQLGYTRATRVDNANTSSLGKAANSSKPLIWLQPHSVSCESVQSCVTSCLTAAPVGNRSSSCYSGNNSIVAMACGHDVTPLSVVGSRELCEIKSVPAELAVRFNSSSTSEVRGVVKVNSDGIWQTVCSGERTFPPETAHVICRQMGYVAYLNISHVQMESSDDTISSILCNGGERHLSECKMGHTGSCRTQKLVWLQCVPWTTSGQFRGFPYGAAVLMFGDGGSGLLRVWNGLEYNPVCDHTFDEADGRVVCRQMGYRDVKAVRRNAYYAGLLSPVAAISHVHCNGNESTLFGCNHTINLEDPCDPFEHVGIQCLAGNDERRGELRLYTGNNVYVNSTMTSGLSTVAGRLEMHISGAWHPICSDKFPSTAAHVACRQLGFSTNNAVYTDGRYGNVGDGIFQIFSCNGHEESLYDCWHLPVHWSVCTSNVAISCVTTDNTPLEGTLRFSPLEGTDFKRLEIFKFGRWGTVCHHSFDAIAGNISCRELGYGMMDELNTIQTAGLSIPSSLPVNVFSVKCDGNEQELIECEQEVYYKTKCNSNDDIVLKCRGSYVPPTSIIPTKTMLTATGSQVSSFSIPLFSSRTWDSTGSQVSSFPIPLYSSQTWDSIGKVSSQVSLSITSASAGQTLVSSHTTSMPPGSSIYPTPEPVKSCPSTTDEVWGITWNANSVCTTSEQPCPSSGLDVTGVVKRTCLANGRWSSTNVLGCSTNLIHNTLDRLSRASFPGNMSPFAVVKEVVATVKELSRFINSERSHSSVVLFPTDVDMIVTIFKMIAKIKFYYFPEQDSTDVVRKLASVCSFLMSEGNRRSWTGVHERTAPLLLESMEEIVEAFGEAGRESLIVVESEIVLHKKVVSITTGVEENITFDFSSSVTNPNLTNFPTNTLLPRVTVPSQFMKDAIERESNLAVNKVSLVCFIISNLENHLPVYTVEDKKGRNGSFVLGSLIVSSQIAGFSPVSMPTTGSPIVITFPLKDLVNVSTENNFSPRCAFWDYGGNFSRGAWSFEGVTTKIVDNSHVQCLSTHMTSFAILVDLSGITVELPEEEYTALSVLTYIGCGVSLVCLVLCIVFFMCQKGELFGKIINYVHFNVCLALALGLFVFIAGIEHAKYFEVSCKLVTGLLHYFFLATFSWMLCEGILLYNLLVVVFGANRKRWIIIYTFLGWGLPVPIVTITAGVSHSHYFVTESTNASHHEVIRACWLPSRDGIIWAFVAPMLAIVVLNVLLLVLSLLSLYKSRKRVLRLTQNKSNSYYQNLKTGKQLLKASVILLPLLGITWGLGVLVVHPDMKVVTYLFLICNLFQGLLIFILHVLRHDKIWGKFKEYLKRLKRSWKSTGSRTGSFKLNQGTSNNYSEGKNGSSGSNSDGGESGCSAECRFVTQSGRGQVLPVATETDRDRRPSTGNDEVVIIQHAY